MSWWNTLTGGAAPEPITPAESKATLGFRREWTCGCGAQLRIRARDDRADGPSNFAADGNGHARVPAAALTWNGLAEERGWRTRPTRCQACQRGLSVAEYKQLRREGTLAAR